MKYIRIIFVSMLLLSGCGQKTNVHDGLTFTYEIDNGVETTTYTVDSLEQSLTKQTDQVEQQVIILADKQVLYNRINQLIIEMNLMVYNGGYYPATLYPEVTIKAKEYPVYKYTITYRYLDDHYYFYFEDYYQIDSEESQKYSESLQQIVKLIEDLPEYEALNYETK